MQPDFHQTKGKKNYRDYGDLPEPYGTLLTTAG